MRFAWRLARRDLRAGGRGLLLLALCLFLGTAALAGIGSLSSSILAALDDQGRQALGGDLELRLSQRRATIAEQADVPHGPASESIRLRGMAEAGGASALIDLKGVDDRWPRVGRFTLAPGALRDRPKGLEAAIAPALADRLGLHVGDTLRIGLARLRVIGLIAGEPDQLGESFRLGPPVIVDMAGLDATALVQPGSLYEARYRLTLPPGLDAERIGKAFVARWPSQGWQARTAAQATNSLRRGIDQLGQFLLLVGLAALTIAGIGVGSGVEAYLGAKTKMIATLKVLGASSRTIAAFFLIELGLVAALGIGAGLAVGAAVPAIVLALAGDALPVQPHLAVYPAPLALAAALALLVALLFTLPALDRARIVPAASLFRDRLAPLRRPSLATIGLMAILGAALVLLAVLTASDRMLAGGFVAAVAVLLAVLALAGALIRVVLARLPRPRRPLLRMALANLHRPGAQTGRLVVALGLGYALFVALAAIDTSLGHEIHDAAPAKAPRFFAIDLQPEDQPRFEATIRATAPSATFEAMPSLRGAIVALKGRRVGDLKEVPAEAWMLRGDRTLTWSAAVPPRNRVVAGRWWPADYHGPPLVSLEARAAESLGLKVGDAITVTVLGVEVPARIAALREVDWGGFGLNFAIIFSPGYIEEAPHSVLASVYAPPNRDGAIAAAVARALPSVSLIRTGDVIGQIGDLLAKIALAIRAASAVAAAAGVTVLVGAVAASSQRRRYDAVLLKLLGGVRAQILGAQAIEYALLATILALLSLGIGLGAAAYVAVRILHLPFAPDWGVVLPTLVLAMLATLAIGLVGALPALASRTAAALRTD